MAFATHRNRSDGRCRCTNDINSNECRRIVEVLVDCSRKTIDGDRLVFHEFTPCSGNENGPSDGAEVFMSECIRVQSSPVDFDAKQFFQSDIAKMDLSAEMIQQGKLAWFVWRFKHHSLEAEHRDKSVRICAIQSSLAIKKSNSLGALSRFDYQLDCTGVQPLLTVLNPCFKRLVTEATVMLLAELHLNV